jgi:hypothetical protein
VDGQSSVRAVTWEEIIVPAVRGGETVESHMRFAAGDVCVVEVRVGGDVDARGEGPDLFEALTAARRSLEAEGVRVACNGARRDVFPSAMLRQAAAGRRAYVLTMPRTGERPVTVDIFEAAPGSSALATVDEQRAWFDQWLQAGEGRRDGSP